jgi:Holliday junction DNA helicase RuvA
LIARLRGTLIETTGAAVVLEVSGVGYEVSVPQSVLAHLPPVGEEAVLLTRQIFREDGVSLYGFFLPFQRRLFDLLLEVKGCGPKVALSLLGALGEDAIVAAITTEDPKVLARAPGIGIRLGERIILEIRDKVLEESAARRIESAHAVVVVPDDELVTALLGLGYRRGEAERAAAEAPDGPVEARLRSALRVLGK